MLVTGDLGFGVLNDFACRFPKQFINAGVAEQNMTGLATGLALEGKIVFTYSIGNFSTLRCLEQIRNDAAYHQANVKIVTVGAGFSYGSLGFSHHATEDIAAMRAIPDIEIASPCDLWEAAEVTRVITYRPGTSYLRLDKSFSESVQKHNETFQFGKIRRLREGHHCTLIATGGILRCAVEAAEILSKEKIECRILSVHTLVPLDLEEIFLAASDTEGIVTIEEHSVSGGLGGMVAENLLESHHYPGFFYRIGLRNTFSSKVGQQDYLRSHYFMDKVAIVEKVKQCLEPGPGLLGDLES